MLEKIFERIDLSKLSETLLYGSSPDDCVTTAASHEKRLKIAENEFIEQLHALCLEQQQGDDVQDAVFELQSKVAPIYFELGMQAGATLYRKLTEEMPAEVQVAVTSSS